MNQTKLFENRAAISAKADPWTSKATGRELTKSGKRDSQKTVVLDALRRCRPYPCTSAELAHHAGLDRYLVARRLSDLERDGFVERGEPCKCDIGGKWAVTWRAK